MLSNAERNTLCFYTYLFSDTWLQNKTTVMHLYSRVYTTLFKHIFIDDLQHREKSSQTADFGVTQCAPIKTLLMQTNPGAAQNELPL